VEGAADPVVTRWIRRTLASDPPRAKSLIVTVWGDALAPHGGELWLNALIRLMAPFGVNDRLVRTSVFRLVRDGWLQARAHGRRSRYRLTSAGLASFERAYRRIYSAPVPAWNGSWDVVIVPADEDAGRRNALRDELRWAGFGAFAHSVYARPTFADVDVTSAIAKRNAMLVHATDLASAQANGLASRVGPAFDLPGIASVYRRYLARFGGMLDAFRVHAERANAEQAFVVRTLLIHAYRRVSLRDPRLPAELLPLDWPGAAAHALARNFYRLTQAQAERFLGRVFAAENDVLPLAAPEFAERFGGLDSASTIVAPRVRPVKAGS